jgi:hypothetical protein
MYRDGMKSVASVSPASAGSIIVLQIGIKAVKILHD